MRILVPAKIFSLLAIFFLGINTVQAQQQPWTLQQCVDHALKNNIQIKQNELNAELAKQEAIQKKVTLLPSVNASASTFYNFGRTVDPFTNEFADEKVRSDRYSINASMTIFSGGQNYNLIKRGELDYFASKYDLEKVKKDISLSIALAYLQILFNQELVAISQNQLKITNQQLERTKRLVEAGSLARGAQLDVESQVAMEELSMVNAQNQLDLAILNLVQLLDLDSVEGFSIVKPDITMPTESIVLASSQQIYADALKTQPEIKSAEVKLQSAERSVAINRGALSPVITLSGSYGTGYSGASQRLLSSTPNGADTIGFTTAGDQVWVPSFYNTFERTPFSDQISDNLNQSFGVSLTIPIFNGFSTKTAISRSKILRENAKYNLELAQNTLQKDIMQSHADAQAGLKKYNATEKSLNALKESFKYTEQRFTVGMVNSLEYNDSKNKLAKAESDLLQAKYDFIFKLKILDFYQGKPLVF